jgi:hypothetical protein
VSPVKLLALVGTVFAVAAPSKTVQLAIVHTVSGCHIWQAAHAHGAATALKLKHGDRITLRISCPMDFRLVQVRGPRLALGDPTMHTGTQRTLRFSKRGVYVLQATNLQSSADVGLQTLGPDNSLRLTVTVS